MAAAIISSIATILGTVLTGILLTLINKGLSLLQLKYNIQLTEQQKDTIRGAVDTGAGLIEHAISAGLLTASEVAATNPVVQKIAAQAMDNVKESAQRLTVTPDVATRMIIARHANLK